MTFLLVALLMIDCKRSAASTNKSGDRGSPCLTPLLQRKTSPHTPFKITDEDPELRMALIQEIHLLPKPLASMILRIASCSILSKAFSKSSFRMTSSFFDLWQMWRYSRAQARQSFIVLDLIKPYWFWWIKPLILDCNLLVRSFVYFSPLILMIYRLTGSFKKKVSMTFSLNW